MPAGISTRLRAAPISPAPRRFPTTLPCVGGQVQHPCPRPLTGRDPGRRRGSASRLALTPASIPLYRLQRPAASPEGDLRGRAGVAEKARRGENKEVPPERRDMDVPSRGSATQAHQGRRLEPRGDAAGHPPLIPPAMSSPAVGAMHDARRGRQRHRYRRCHPSTRIPRSTD
jgi:hypothetical protein